MVGPQWRTEPRRVSSVSAADQTAGQERAASLTQVTTPPRISMIEMDDRILIVSADDHLLQVGSMARGIVDSGPASVCPLFTRLRSQPRGTRS